MRASVSFEHIVKIRNGTRSQSLNSLMVNHKCFSLVDLLHRLHCMAIAMLYQQINMDGGIRLPPVMDFIRRRRCGHIARLTQGTPAHNALHCQVGLASGRSLGRDWRRRPGRPRTRWTDQLHGGATRQSELATR